MIYSTHLLTKASALCYNESMICPKLFGTPYFERRIFMKKSLLLLVLVLCFVCVINLSACTQSHTHNYVSTVTPPTCTDKGYTTYVCSECGDSYINNYTEPNGHSFSQWTIVKWPTTTEEGLQERECACGVKETTALSSTALSQGLEYRLNEDKSSYSLIGIGNCYDKEIIIPATYEGLPVTRIETRAFQDRHSIKSINIPDTVTYIADRAFYNCTGLESINIPSTIETIHEFTFGCCKSLKSITIPDSVNSIEEYAFSDCIALTSIVIPDSVTNIERDILQGCESLSSLTIPYYGKYISFYFYGSNEDIPQSLKTVILTQATLIDSDIFINCKYIETVVLPESVVEIGKEAFSGCSNLQSINIPDALTKIEAYAFNDCTSLEIVSIPDSVTTIGEYAFYNCPLKEVNIPDSLTSPIGQYAFNSVERMVIPRIDGGTNEDVFTTFVDIFGGKEYTPNVARLIIEGGNKINDFAFEGTHIGNITIPNTVKSIGNNAFAYTSITNINLPSSIESIGENAFSNCWNLKNITIPDSVTTIGAGAFGACSSLESVVLSNSLSSIAANTFFKCDSLQTIIIPDSVKSICSQAFHSCTTLSSVKIGNSVIEIGSRAFQGCSINSIEIPDSVVTIEHWALEGIANIRLGKSVTDIDSMNFASIEVSKDNPYYSSIDGNLYNKSGDTLIRYAVKKSDTSFTLPHGVTAIQSGAFSGTTLKHITLPDSMTSIGDRAFYNINSLESITIPDSIKNIGQEAFYDCSSLKMVDLPKHLEIIGDYAFGNCKSLITVMLKGSSQTVIGSHSFAYCTSLTYFETGTNSISVIGDSAFYECTSLQDIIMSTTLKEIGDNAFYGCVSIKNFAIPYSKVTSIGDRAFYNCTSLEYIYLPATLTDIESQAFEKCSALTVIAFNGVKVQWESINKDNYWNRYTGNYTIYCSDVNIAKDGTIIQK